MMEVGAQPAAVESEYERIPTRFCTDAMLERVEHARGVTCRR